MGRRRLSILATLTTGRSRHLTAHAYHRLKKQPAARRSHPWPARHAARTTNTLPLPPAPRRRELSVAGRGEIAFRPSTVHRGRLKRWRTGQWHRWHPDERRSVAFVLVRCWGRFLVGPSQRLSCGRPDHFGKVHRRLDRRPGVFRHRSKRGGCCKLGEQTGNNRINHAHAGRWPIDHNDHSAGLPVRQRRRAGGRLGRMDGRRRGVAGHPNVGRGKLVRRRGSRRRATG